MWDNDLAYERFMGRWSRLLADRLVADVLSAGAGTELWVDIGCGTGSLTAAALAAGVSRVIAVEPSASFASAAAARFEQDPVEVHETDATSLPASAGGADAVLACLVLNFTPDPVAALSAGRAALRQGGVASYAVWDYDDERSFLGRYWSCVEQVLGRRSSSDERGEFEVCSQAGLASAAAEAGWTGPVTTIDVATTFTGPDDLWDPFTGGVGVAGRQHQRMSSTDAAAVRDLLVADVAPDGSWPVTLPNRAFVVSTTAAD